MRMLILGLLLSVFLMGSGASTEGIREARKLQHKADVALSKQQMEIAYHFYSLLAETFPGTRHGRLAKKRVRSIARHLARPSRSPASEDTVSSTTEFFDFLTWP